MNYSVCLFFSIIILRQQTLELERLADQRKRNDESWERQQQLLMEAEEDRRRMIELEDQKLSDQRVRLAALKRETKMKELRTLDEARERYLEQQQRIRGNEIKKMDKEIEKKVLYLYTPLECGLIITYSVGMWDLLYRHH